MKTVYVCGEIIKRASSYFGPVDLCNKDVGNIGVLAVFSNKSKANKFAKASGATVLEMDVREKEGKG